MKININKKMKVGIFSSAVLVTGIAACVAFSGGKSVELIEESAVGSERMAEYVVSSPTPAPEKTTDSFAGNPESGKFMTVVDGSGLLDSLIGRILDEYDSSTPFMAVAPPKEDALITADTEELVADAEAGNTDTDIGDAVLPEGSGTLEEESQLADGSEDISEVPEDEQLDLMAEEEIVYLTIYKQGTDDRSVASIQEQLMELGFMEYAEPTTYYGSITMEAVKLFQRQNDLKQDGIIGEQTLGMLMSPEAKRYLLKNGMEGEDIKRVQHRLYELGYLASSSAVTGFYGDATEDAVKHFQERNNLAVDGKIGQMTTELLYSSDVNANLLSFGDKSDIVLACQERLKELGYLTTKPDGLYGNDTVAAVKLFQSRNDLVVDGYLGPSTREVLNSSSAVTNGLVLGDEGDTVKRVQELLIKYGYMNSGSATGYFGEVTERAVKSFQRNNGLSVDGNVGAKTMSKLTGTSVVYAGQSGGGSESGSTGGGQESGAGQDNSGETLSGSVSSLIKVAKSKLGCPYSLGAKGPNKFDCSGFVYWCLNQIGVKQSYITSYGWRTVGKYKKITKFSDIKAGDIIVVYGHVGIAAGDGMVIDASSSNGEIVYRSLGSWWKKNFICAWRIFD